MALENLDPSTTAEPEVVQAVIKEVNGFGDNLRGMKQNYEELRKAHNELKQTMETVSSDVVSEAKLNKLSEDIVTRQQALDEAHQKSSEEAKNRLDAIEVALRRAPKGNGSRENAGSLEEEAKAFGVACMAAKAVGESGVRKEDAENVKCSVEEYLAYKEAFDNWCRKYGGDRNRMQDENEIKALQAGIESDGGVTIPVSMSQRIIQRLFESDPLRSLASVESITTGALEWMVDIDEAGYAWEGESTGETTIVGETSTPKFRKKRIVTHTLSARPTATQQLLEDSGVNIEAWLAAKVASRFMRGEAASFINGDGVGKPKGILSYAHGTEWGKVEQVNMGAAAALTADGFIDLKYALKEYYLERGVWLMNRQTVAAAMKLKTSGGTNEYIWKPSQLASDPSSAILNLPVRMSTTMPTVAANALSVALADWKEAYMIVDRIGLTMQRDPYTRKPFIEFYVRKRVGGDVVNYEALKIGKIAS